MIRRHAYLFRLALMSADAVLALAVVAFVAMLRSGGGEDWQTALNPSLPNPQLAVAALILIWIDLLWYHGLYKSRARWNIRSDASEILKATVTLAAIALSALFLLKLPDVSRLFLLFVFPMLAVAALAVRVCMRVFLIYLREHGRNTRYMLIVGANRRAKIFTDAVESHAELGLFVIGHLTAGGADNDVRLRRRVIGTIDDLEAVLHNRIVDEVAICLPFSMEDLIEQAARLCQQEGKVVRIPVAPVERALTLGRFETIDAIGVYSLANGPDRILGLIAKRLIDVVGAATLLVLLSPAFLLMALAIKLDSRGPALFRQERLGLQGRAFQVIKFRTMCVDAERQLEDLRRLNEINGHAFKLHDDPRITRVGCFLRRMSLDELPQLWNVLLGQMSLVGPRPPLPREVVEYDVWHRRRLSMKPGMTGLWQVTRRRSREFDEWVEQDLEYIDGWSLWLDFKIIARTVPAMLAGR